MTKEEAKHIVDIAFGVAKAVRRVGEERTYHEDEIREAKNMAMEALEQEPVLDKIEAEIERLNPVDYGSLFSYEAHKGAGEMQNDVLQIIDKYKAESEDDEE